MSFGSPTSWLLASNTSLILGLLPF